MAELRPLIVKVAKMLTDSMDAKLGLVKMDEKRPEYWMLDKILTDDMARMLLKMGVRKPTTPEALAEDEMGHHKSGVPAGRDVRHRHRGI